jgi:hypothetical protein
MTEQRYTFAPLCAFMAGSMENFTFYSYFDYNFSKGNVMWKMHSNRFPIFVVSFGAGF